MSGGTTGRKLLPRAERRAALIESAKRAFLHGGFAATSIDQIAAEAGVSTVLIYRHFDSKADLYRAVLADVRARFSTSEPTGFSPERIDAIVEAARADPDGFRLLFRHAAREPEFRSMVDDRTNRMRANAERMIEERGLIPDPALRSWAASLAPAVFLEAVLSWVDAGCPDPERAADRARGVISGVMRAIAGPGIAARGPGAPGDPSQEPPAPG